MKTTTETNESNSKKPIVARMKILVDKSDGTHTEVNYFVPERVSEDLLVRLISWEEHYMVKVKHYRDYLAAAKAFIEQVQGIKKSAKKVKKATPAKTHRRGLKHLAPAAVRFKDVTPETLLKDVVLQTRLKNGLKKWVSDNSIYNFNTLKVRWLSTFTATQLLRWNNVGENGVNDLKLLLKKAGLEFTPEPEPKFDAMPEKNKPELAVETINQ